MSNIIGKSVAVTAILLLCAVFIPQAYSQEEIEYKKFKLEDVSCDVGIQYKKTIEGMMLGVSAIATGKGSEFRKWNVSDIRMRLGRNRYDPNESGKFYVTEESFFRVPGAVLFAAIGALGEYSNNDFNNTMSKIGVGLGMGLIALQAKGQIAGQRCIFYIPSAAVDKIEEGKDDIEIVINNENLHVENTIKIGIIKPTLDAEKRYDFEKMKKDDILDRMDELKAEIKSLEEEQSGYKYGEDPQYDVIERKIEELETERGVAYKAWFEKKNGRSGVQK